MNFTAKVFLDLNIVTDLHGSHGAMIHHNHLTVLCHVSKILTE